MALETKRIQFSITTNKTDQTFTAQYHPTMALVEFKVKLEMIVGIYRQDMRLYLKDPYGKLIGEMIGDDKTLLELGLKDGLTVHVIDVTNNSPAFTADSEKYVLTEEKYDSRQKSVRKWKQELGVLSSQSDNEAVPKDFEVGKRCEVIIADTPKRSGTIAFIGKTHFKPGIWIGVRYDQPVGKNDGSVEGQRYFECEQGHGGFVFAKSVNLL